MKILFVNTTLHTGGASIACQRLMQALASQGHEVRLIVRDDKSLMVKWRFLWERLMLLRHVSRQRLFSIDDGRCGKDITQTADYAWADVIHLHWINQAMISMLQLDKLLRCCKKDGKRVVWTMHDIWAATGICHLPGNCERWHSGCGNCPLLRRPGDNDLSTHIYNNKLAIYAGADVRFVTCSKFLGETAKKSKILRESNVVAIPNPLDTKYFSPGPSERLELRLPENRKLILFVAYNVDDENKNFRMVAEAVEKMIQTDAAVKDKIALVVVGKKATSWQNRLACDCYPFEYVSNRATMRALYRSCDCLVVSSKMENLPNTIAEAKACGLPPVAPRVGGIPEMICHKEDGFLAESGNVESMAEGLRFLLFHPHYNMLSMSARNNAVAEFSEENVAKRYEALYQEA